MLTGTPPSPDTYPGPTLLLQLRNDVDPEVVDLLTTLRVTAGPGHVTAREFSERVGLSSRFSLDRRLKRLGLLPLRDLQAHMGVLAMLVEVRRRGVSLSRIAWLHGSDPASWLRVVKRTTGLPWSVVLARGVEELVEQMNDALWGSPRFVVEREMGEVPLRSPAQQLTSSSGGGGGL